jgi:hypothetical protein
MQLVKMALKEEITAFHRSSQNCTMLFLSEDIQPRVLLVSTTGFCSVEKVRPILFFFTRKKSV